MVRLSSQPLEQPREWRRRVALTARIKIGANWADGHILNISSRGMLLHYSRPIAIGSQVEVRNEGLAVSATVVWKDGFRTGLLCQRQIDLANWVGAGGDQALARSQSGPIAAVAERRAFPRTHEQSRELARKLEFLAIAAIAVLIAVSVSSLAASVLLRPVALIDSALTH